MKIAVPILDETRISPHFGRSSAFLVFDTEAGAIRGRELRPNLHGHHAQGAHEHGQHPGHGHDHGHDHGHHDHSGFTSLLSDCQVVISAGMGPGALNALQQAGMRVILVRPGQGPEVAVREFIEGRLTASEQGVCRAHS